MSDDPRAVLRRHGLRAKKSFGQNFLVAPHVARTIAEACVHEGELARARVVELGAGTGALTSLLAARARVLFAVERDRDLVPLLEEAFDEERAHGRVVIVEGDAQTADVRAMLGEAEEGAPRVLCGNLPYQITGRLLQRAVEQADALERCVFMVQEEVADRLAASPGSKDYGALTVFVRAAFDVKRVMTVSRGSFHPPPEVTSAVVALTALRPPRARETPAFRTVVRRAFEMRRKTLKNAWAGVLPPEALAAAAQAAGVALDARGETLDVDAFARMAAEVERAQMSS